MPSEENEERTVDEALEQLVEEAAEGLWLRLRDVILVEKRLERFVF